MEELIYKCKKCKHIINSNNLIYWCPKCFTIFKTKSEIKKD